MTQKIITTSRFLAAVVLGALLTGCKAREMGIQFSDHQSTTVDDTWLTALKTCWPELAHNGLSDESLRHELADPLHFRAAFAPYGPFPDGSLLTIVSHPVTDAPTPDTSLFKNASTAVLSPAQAARGITPSPADHTNPETALCSIHNGSPVGFK